MHAELIDCWFYSDLTHIFMEGIIHLTRL